MERALSGAPPVVSFGLQNPGHPWWWIGARLAERLVGFTDPLLPQARMSLVTPAARQGALFNPIEISAGELAFGITTPSVSAAMALRGQGPFERPCPGLRAIAAYPHVDYVVLAVDEELGISSLGELAERELPLRLVTGRRTADGRPDVLTFAIGEILRLAGAPFEALEAWGGSVVYGGPTHVGGVRLLDGGADALFHEAQMSPVWAEIASARTMRILAVPEEIREHMAREFGFAAAEVPAGHPSGAVDATPTLDFGGWLVLCHEDVPDEWAYAVARACDETRSEVEGDQRGRGELELPIDPVDLFTRTVIPLHHAASAYARERGYLGQG